LKSHPSYGCVIKAVIFEGSGHTNILGLTEGLSLRLAPVSRPVRRRMRDSTRCTRPVRRTMLQRLVKKEKMWPTSFPPSQRPTSLAMRARSTPACASGLVRSQASKTGPQSRSVLLTKMMPARLTVAGEAFRRSSTSNMSFTLSVMGMRSPLACGAEVPKAS
jgi:hypothetical protein